MTTAAISSLVMVSSGAGILRGSYGRWRRRIPFWMHGRDARKVTPDEAVIPKIGIGLAGGGGMISRSWLRLFGAD